MSELPVVFHSQGVPLVGRFHRAQGSLGERRPVVLVTGSWLTVKEQMPSTYAKKLVSLGYDAFVFDFAGFGESRGEPRQAEMPARKIGDIIAAVDFVRTMSFVDAGRVACLAICASAQYALAALARGAPVRSFASVAGWYHDAASIAPFYGGDAGVTARLARAGEAIERYVRTSEVVTVPAYRDGDDRAGMFFKLDYYARADRGAVAAWRNEMAEMSWLYWLTFDGLSAAEGVSAPALFVHGDGCVLPEHVKRIHARVRGPKELVWSKGDQVDFYDQPELVDAALAAVKPWFDKTLGA
jgi:fermentation-respiration switch protein FrsA (DUF1100 family)